MERFPDHDPSRTARPDAPAELPSGTGKPADQGGRVGEQDSIAPAGSAGDTSVTYVPCPGATPEAELAALVTVYRYLLDHYHEENVLGASEGTGNSPDRALPRTASASTDKKKRCFQGI